VSLITLFFSKMVVAFAATCWFLFKRQVADKCFTTLALRCAAYLSDASVLCKQEHFRLMWWGDVTDPDVANQRCIIRFGAIHEALVIGSVWLFRPLRFSIYEDYIPSPSDYRKISSTAPESL